MNNNFSWSDDVEKLTSLLRDVSVRDSTGAELGAEEGFARFTKYTIDVRSNENTVYLIGNGASASMASHVAADLAKNGLVHTEVFTDLALITAIANDYSYDQVYSEPLRRRIKKNDLLVAISSSGNSPNIIRACVTAKSLGCWVVSISAMSPDNAIRRICDLNFYVAAETYGLAETSHAAILHYWIDKTTQK